MASHRNARAATGARSARQADRPLGSPGPIDGLFLGPSGALPVKVGILMSVLGVNAAVSLSGARLLYALGYEGLVPRIFGQVHATTRAPVLAILSMAGASLAPALTGGFAEMAVLSVVARFATIIPTCIAVLAFRRTRSDDPPGFRIPFGPVVPLVALGLSLWIVAQAEPRQPLWGGAALVAGWLLYASRRWLGGEQAAAVD